LVGEPVATLKAVLGDECPSMEQVRDSLLFHFTAVCNRELERYAADGGTPKVLHDLMADI
jgi:hypothetical protein